MALFKNPLLHSFLFRDFFEPFKMNQDVPFQFEPKRIAGL
jgi:hypothetical protein